MRQVIILVVLGMVISTAASAEIRSGKWSFTVTTKADGMTDPLAEMQAAMANMSESEKAMMQQMMGGMNVQMGAEGITTTTSHCVSADDPVPQMEQMEGCTTTNDVNGDVVTFESTCPDSHSTGTLTYSEDAMQGLITTTKTENGEEMGMTMEITGKYEGPCSE